MIVLIGAERDPHLLRVSQEIELLGATSRIVSTEQLGECVQINIRQAGHGGLWGWIASDEWEVSSDEIDVLWLRRPTLPSITAEISDPDDRRFGRNEWRVTIETLAACVPQTRVFNLPTFERAATKPRQLQAAAALGLRVPDTLITSSSDAARAFAKQHCNRIIHKALTSPPHAFLETRRWSAEDHELLHLLPLAPVLLQEEIRGVADLRITIVGQYLYTALIPASTGGDVDSRLDLRQGYQPWEIDPALALKLKQLLRTLGLATGTVDLKLLESGECVFFEVNPQGQFLYIEIMTGQPIAQGFAAALVQSARSSV